MRLLLAALAILALSCSAETPSPSAPSAAGQDADPPVLAPCDTFVVLVDDWDPETGEHSSQLWHRIACPDSTWWERVR
jgi:hypothetical protein